MKKRVVKTPSVPYPSTKLRMKGTKEEIEAKYDAN